MTGAAATGYSTIVQYSVLGSSPGGSKRMMMTGFLSATRIVL